MIWALRTQRAQLIATADGSGSMQTKSAFFAYNDARVLA